MNALIKIGNSVIGNGEIQTVNARGLHSFLQIKKDFSNWIKKQVERARLLENRDYVVFAQKGVNLEGGRPSTEYHLTLEAGKHIAMLALPLNHFYQQRGPNNEKHMPVYNRRFVHRHRLSHYVLKRDKKSCQRFSSLFHQSKKPS